MSEENVKAPKKETEKKPNGVVVKNESTGYGYKYSSLADLHRAGVAIPKMRICPTDKGDYVEYYDDVSKTWEKGAKIIVPEARGMNVAQAYGAALTYARRYTVQMSQSVACDDDDEIENIDQNGNRKDLTQKQPSHAKVDFRAVRERLTEINNLDELNEYWQSLKLSEKQASVLKADFTARKVKIGVGL